MSSGFHSVFSEEEGNRSAAEGGGSDLSGCGGFIAGRLLRALSTRAAEVTLHRTAGARALTLQLCGVGSARLLDDRGRVRAAARPSRCRFEPPAAIDPARAIEASEDRSGSSHAARIRSVAGGSSVELALGLCPGVTGEGRAAAPWTPTLTPRALRGDVAPETVGAALERVALHAIVALDAPTPERVDAEGVTLRLEAATRAAQPHVVVAEVLEASRGDYFVRAALYTAAGELRASARSVWSVTEPAHR